MPLPNKLTVYDTTLGQVMRFLAPRPPGVSGKDPRFAAFDALPLRYVVELSPEAYRLLQEHPLLKQKIQLDMIAIGQRIVRDRIQPMLGRSAAVTPALRTRVEAALKQGEADVNALVDGVLRRHAEMNEAWGKYYRSMRKDLIFIAIGMAATVTSLALSVPTGGASIALAIASGARSIAGAINKLGDCWRTAEEQQQRIQTSLKALLSAYQASVHKGRAIQIGGGILDAVGVTTVAEALPFVNRQLLPSLQKIQADMGVYKGKLGHLYAEANRLAAQLFDLLDQIDEWKRANPGAAMPKLDQIEKTIAELLDSGVRKVSFRHRLTIAGAYSRYETGMVEVEKFNGMITQLNGIERHPRAIEVINGVIKVLANLAYAGAAYGAEVPETDAARKVGALAVTIANDVVGTANDFKEFGELVKGEASPQQVQDYAQQISASYTALPVSLPARPPRPSGLHVARPPIRPPRPAAPPPQGPSHAAAPTRTPPPPPPRRPPPPPPRQP